MSIDFITYACLILGLSAALVAGVFQSFSDFVMAGLIKAKPEGGIESMQQLNRTVMRSAFLAMFLILVPVSIAFAAYAWFWLSGFSQRLIIIAASVYVPAVFLVTVAGNVPMNKRLDQFDPTSAEAKTYWRTYGRVWTRWNTLRTLGAVSTAVCYLLAAIELS